MSLDEMSVEELNELAADNAKDFLLLLKDVKDPLIQDLFRELFSLTLYRTSALVKSSNETSDSIEELLEGVKDVSKKIVRSLKVKKPPLSKK